MLKNVSDNINNILMPDTLKHLNSLRILEDEEYILNGNIQNCYACDSDDLEYYFVKYDEIEDFFININYIPYTESIFLSDFIKRALKQEDEIPKLSKESRLMLVFCSKCHTILKIGNFIMFDKFPISRMAFEKWNLISLHSRDYNLPFDTVTYTWEICPKCGDMMYTVLDFNNKKVKQCRNCMNTVPYFFKVTELYDFF